MNKKGYILLALALFVLGLIVGPAVTSEVSASQDRVCLRHESQGEADPSWIKWMPESAANNHVRQHEGDAIVDDGQCGDAEPTLEPTVEPTVIPPTSTPEPTEIAPTSVPACDTDDCCDRIVAEMRAQTCQMYYQNVILAHANGLTLPTNLKPAYCQTYNP